MANPDYIPETKVVEADYIHSNSIVRAGFGNTNETYSLEFNRWLKQHDAEVAKKTEERIISLVDKWSLHYGKTHGPNASCSICDLIEIIGGVSSE